MDQKFTAPIDRVCARLSDAKWLEVRSLALGEPSARVKAKKHAKGATISMTRQVKRDLHVPVGEALVSEAALQFEKCSIWLLGGRWPSSHTVRLSGQHRRLWLPCRAPEVGALNLPS